MASSMKFFMRKNHFESVDSYDIASALNYIMDEDAPSMYFRELGCAVELDGEKEPEKMREMAQSWNRARQELAIKLLRELVEKPEFDTGKSYRARKAFDAADNNFGPGVDFAVIIDGPIGPYAATLIPDEMREAAIAAPEKFCVVNATYDF